MLKNKRFFHAMGKHFSDAGKPRIERTPLRILVLSIFIIFFAVAYFSSAVIKSEVNDLEMAKMEQMQKIGTDYLDMAMQKSLARASIIAGMPNVIELFEAGNRDKLYSVLKNIYAEQVGKYGAGTAQFDIPPHEVFLRLHDPEKHGDDLSFRSIIMMAMAEQTPLKGISVSRSGAGLFGIAPIRNAKGKFLGVLELSQSFDMLINSLKDAYGIEAAVFFDEETLHSKATSMKKEVFSSNNRFGSYVKIASTNWDLISQLIEPEDLKSTGPIEPFTKDFKGAHYGVVALPLLSASGSKSGELLLLIDLSIDQKAAKTLSIYMWLFSLFGAVLISGLLMTVVKGGILIPLARLSEAYKSLVNNPKGEADVIDLHDYPGPVKPLAESYQLLLEQESKRKD